MPLRTVRRGSMSSHAKFFFFVRRRVNIPFPPATSAIAWIVLPYRAAMKSATTSNRWGSPYTGCCFLLISGSPDSMLLIQDEQTVRPSESGFRRSTSLHPHVPGSVS